jgi:hypothetical protein
VRRARGPGWSLKAVNAALVRVAAVRAALRMASSGASPHRSVSTKYASALTTTARSCLRLVMASEPRDGPLAGPGWFSKGASA